MSVEELSGGPRQQSLCLQIVAIKASIKAKEYLEFIKEIAGFEDVESVTAAVKKLRDIMRGAFKITPEDDEGEVSKVEKGFVEENNASWHIASWPPQETAQNPQEEGTAELLSDSIL